MDATLNNMEEHGDFVHFSEYPDTTGTKLLITASSWRQMGQPAAVEPDDDSDEPDGNPDNGGKVFS